MSHYPTLFLDKVAITIPLAGGRGNDVHQAISDSSERWCDYISLASLRNRSYLGQYRFTTLDGNSAVLLLQPRNSRNNYFKLEYSPNNFGESGRALLGEYLREILGADYINEILGGRLTRLDVAFDIRRVRLKDLLIVDTRGRKSAIIRGLEGEAETYYFPFNGTNQLCVYNKLREEQDRTGTSSPNRKQAAWTRFEYRYHRLNRYSLRDIVGRLENPFDNFTVKRYDENDGVLDGQDLRMFFDACRLAGINSTLAEISNSEKRTLLAAAYSAFPTPAFWLRRTSIWGGLRQAVENALPLINA